MDTWANIQHWNLVLPPSRPSAWQLNRIRDLVHNMDLASPVAVLGSTPEFRDLLHECGFRNIFVLDKSSEFYNTMSEMRIYRNQENLVLGDWLDTLSQHRAMFSLILSDLTSGNIAYERRSEFYNAITEALNIGGVFADKILTHPGPNIRLKDLFDKYSKLPLNLLQANYFSCEVLFCSELLDKKKLVDTTFFYSTLQEITNHPRLLAFIEYAKLITPPNCIWYYGRKWYELRQSYCPRLSIVRTEDDDATSPYFGRLKFIWLQRS